MNDLREANFTAWHFLPSDLCLGNGDGRLIVAGETLFVEGEIELCVHGLHWSRRALDALDYAPGDHVSLVVPIGAILEDKDKGVSQGRRTLWMADATEVLRGFSRWCALSVAHLCDMPPVVRQYLESGDESPLVRQCLESGDESLREEAWEEIDAEVGDGASKIAIRASAWASARDAAKRSISVAARATDRDAAKRSVSVAARATAWDAANAASLEEASSASWEEARVAQNAELERRLMALAPPDGPQRRFL